MAANAAQIGHANPANLSRLVIVGDSLSAGVQNFSLLDTQQIHGYASVLAQQAGVPLFLPLVPYPGAPNKLELVSPGPPPEIQQVPGSLPPIPRDNPLIVPFNVSVPGITVAQSLTMRPTLEHSADPVQGWATIVLGFPSLFLNQKPTQIELAKSLFPTTVIEWLGNNDALVPALLGQLPALTPIDSFTASYRQVLDELAKTHAQLITANIPDVTEIAFFTSGQRIAERTGLPVQTVTSMLGIAANDYVRVTGQPFVDKILTGQMPGPLPQACPSPLAALSSSPVPCVLTAADAAVIRSDISCYNDVIAAESAAHGALLIDAHALVDRIYATGYTINGQELTTDFLGGLFSLDGIHPTNTGYGIIANLFIDEMNKSLHTNIPSANLSPIAARDPLVFRNNPLGKAGAAHLPQAPSSCVAPQAIGKPAGQ
ncbi:MAG TPA: hypothetical protein VH369_19600 [Bryobacteraceae bacterium]